VKGIAHWGISPNEPLHVTIGLMAIFTYQRHGYENQFSTKYDNEFENWFADLARKLHPGGDCQPVRLTQGDGKIDVYVINEQLVYQCYGPQLYSPSKAKKKITDDFMGAYCHLDGELSKWIFVHNHPTGCLDKDSVKAINKLKSELAADELEVEILVWGKEDLWRELYERLPYSLLRDMFGEPTPIELDYASLEHVLDHLERVDYEPNAEPLSQPALEKLNFNKLGPSYKMHIEMGYRGDKIVSDYFSNSPDPELGERIAERFRQRYKRLKTVDRLSPDDISDRLQSDAGWKNAPDAKRQQATLSVLSYFFHQCDIFENIES
jgi:hypothetical protein